MNQENHHTALDPSLAQFAVDRASDGILCLLPDGTHAYANPAICNMLGYSREQLSSLTLCDLNLQFTPALWANHWAELKQAGTLLIQAVLQKKDKSLLPVEIQANFLEREGREYNCTIIRAITERDRADKVGRTRQQATEAELHARQGDRRFRDLANAMPLIVWTAKPNGVIDYGNKTLHEYAGITTRQLRTRWLGLIHPEDRSGCLRAWGEATTSGIPYSFEFRIRNQHDGNFRWHLVRAVPIRNASGTITKWYGTATDIHGRKLAEEEISRLASRLHNTLESITDAFYTLDREWRFTYLNKEAERLLQRSSQDLLGKVIWDEFKELQGTHISREYERAIRQRCTVQFEELSPYLGIWIELHGYPSEEGLTVYFRDITERKQAEDNIQFMASYDPLTRLPNRRLVQDRLQQELAANARSKEQGAVLFLDLDNFKALNDTLGHDEGDSLLQQVAVRLTTCLRGEDTVGRFGGDEFVLILGKLGACPEAAASKAKGVGKKILALFKQPYQLGKHQRQITPSIGITVFGDQQESVNELLKRADFAMYQAKTGGRNTMRVFDPVMQASVNARLELEADMRSGLEREEFLPYYQPQVDGAGRLTGAEALARWQHPQRGLVAPGEFIPLAEDTGLILPLGRSMLKAVCTQLAVWAREPETAGLNVAVNISAKHFHHPDFVTRVLDVVNQTGANPQRLKLELTESMLLEDVDDTIKKMTLLKAKGVCFSLDDFGTGYSSLYYLKRLPLDQLKIDQRFVRDVITDPNDAAIVRTIVMLAHSLGLDVIAEGVETEKMRDFLSFHGCRSYQGYFFGQPLPIKKFEHYVQHTDALSAQQPRP